LTYKGRVDLSQWQSIYIGYSINQSMKDVWRHVVSKSGVHTDIDYTPIGRMFTLFEGNVEE